MGGNIRGLVPPMELPGAMWLAWAGAAIHKKSHHGDPRRELSSEAGNGGEPQVTLKRLSHKGTRPSGKMEKRM